MLAWLTRMLLLMTWGYPSSRVGDLKGLWRDAYRDVVDTWQQCGQGTTSVEQVFGDSGQGPNDGDACLHIANAELKNTESLKEWLEYLQHDKIRKLHADDVVQHYATVRSQTAIERLTGSSKENTLPPHTNIEIRISILGTGKL